MNALCKALGIKKPVIQGPMAWISTASLAAAVSESGALGVLGTGVGVPAFIREQVKLIKSKTSQPYAVNLGFHPRFFRDENFTEILEILGREKVPIIHLDSLCDRLRRLEPDFAIPRVRAFKDQGMKVIIKVFTVRDAITAQNAGADVIIAKGWEGGGHITFQSSLVIIPQIADAVDLPVVASGGIANGRGMAAAMLLGAAGVEMGTAFLAAEETEINAKSKDRILQAGDFDTVEAGFSTGEPCRQLCNALAEKVIEIETSYGAETARQKTLELVANSSRKGMLEGDVDNGALMAGQCVGMIRQVRPAGAIVDDILGECGRILAAAWRIELS